MNRRSFFGTIATALAGFSVLPAATTYTRLWKATRLTGPIINPEWETTHYEVAWVRFDGELINLPMPYRLAVPPPWDIWGKEQFITWVEQHRVPKYIHT